MIAAVFFLQPVGQLLATLMAFTATHGFRARILDNADPSSCSVVAVRGTNPLGAECARAVDQAWRLVIGLGAFPAALAIVSRLTIPESVEFHRYSHRM
jgi:MFS transporter, PHS family, inorganic phosphate transporter